MYVNYGNMETGGKWCSLSFYNFTFNCSNAGRMQIREKLNLAAIHSVSYNQVSNVLIGLKLHKN